MQTKERKNLIAEQYAQRNGIVGYKVDGNRMIYYENHKGEPCTVKVIVRLNTLKEERQKLNYFNQKGNLNMKGEKYEEKMAL